MLIEFRVENHRSLRDEQVLSMEAAKRNGEDLRPRQIDDESSIVPVAALYGANASGKSNLLAALRFMRDAVVLSHRMWAPDEGVPRDAFAWGGKKQEPSLYELTFILNGTRTQFGFVVDDERFLEEWLHVWPKGRKQVWYERDRDTYKFGDSLRGENRVSESVTRANALFLSTAVQNRHEQLEPVFRWFRSMRMHQVAAGRRGLPALSPFWLRYAADDVRNWLTDAKQPSLFPDPEGTDPMQRLERFREFLRAADVGITDVKLKTTEDARGERTRIFLQHKSSEPDSWLPLDEESSGTKQLFRLAPLVLNALEEGQLLIVDELEASFHPLLAIEIVRTFNDPKRNPRNAQLVFSTHDTNLLGTTIGAPSLRRDQVWLTEKTPEGATVVYPLTDFKPRKAENLERGYLQGRYGAIPFLGDLAQVAK